MRHTFLDNGPDEWIENDVCTCGHKRIEHFNTVQTGHGRCIRIGSCACRKFTWARNLLESN